MKPFKFKFGACDRGADCAEGYTAVVCPANLFKPKPCRVDQVTFVPMLVPQSADDVDRFKIYKVQIDTADAAATLGLEEVNLADVIPGQYEGGFKLWEGAQDLMDILVYQVSGPWPDKSCSAAVSNMDSNLLAMLPSTLQNKRVLELGCGHGLPGILCMLAGAQVVFHDLNRGVIEMATFANIVRNMLEHREELAAERARFIDGDFHSASDVLCEKLGSQHFDLILTAESIYNSASVPQLLAAFDGCLAPKGIVLVAAKSYYFGVGGGVATFKKSVANDGRFKCRSLARIDDGKSNMREVMLMHRF